MDGLSPLDRLAIDDLIALHGHLMDNGEFDRLGELFTADLEYDLSAFGGGVLRGFDAVRDASLALGDNNPVAHHVTNIVIVRVGQDDFGDVVEAVSKGIGIRTDGSSGSVVYEDVIRRGPSGWRIARRAVLSRQRPPAPLARPRTLRPLLSFDNAVVEPSFA